MVRILAAVIGSLLLLSACGSADSGTATEEMTGFIFIDSAGSHVCGTRLESYPPQCGEPSAKLLDLDPGTVVALTSPKDPTLAPVSWTDYGTTVSGERSSNELVQVRLVDPVHEAHSDGLVLRVADLGIATNEPVIWPIDLTNLTDKDLTLVFSDGQRIEITLSDGSGEVYRWSDGVFFTQAIEEFDLPAGATFPWVVRGEPTGLSPGTYTAKAWVTAPEAEDVVVTWTVEVTG
jgi:hypothetical protein